MSQEVHADRVLQGEIERLTRRLRLPYVRSAAPELLKTARSQRWDPAEALRVLLEEEVADDLNQPGPPVDGLVPRQVQEHLHFKIGRIRHRGVSHPCLAVHRLRQSMHVMA